MKCSALQKLANYSIYGNYVSKTQDLSKWRTSGGDCRRQMRPLCSPSALGDAKGTPTAVSEPSEARNALPLQPQRHLRPQGEGPYHWGGARGAGRQNIYIYIYVYPRAG